MVQLRKRARWMRIVFVVLLCCATTAVVFAKHGAPAHVAPVVDNGIRYEAPNDQGLRAYVQAWDLLTGRKLWAKTIARHFYFPLAGSECMHYEFISRMSLSDGHLILATDRGRLFSLDLSTRSVRKLRTTPELRP
jgi:hypothetical protein